MKTAISKEDISAYVDQILRLRSDQLKKLNPDWQSEAEGLMDIAIGVGESQYGAMYVRDVGKSFGIDMSVAGIILTDGIKIGMKIMEMIHGQDS